MKRELTVLIDSGDHTCKAEEKMCPWARPLRAPVYGHSYVCVLDPEPHKKLRTGTIDGSVTGKDGDYLLRLQWCLDNELCPPPHGTGKL